ncbi:MAG TPA: fused MFS/spermidine synthase [Polyangia bacterium]
MTAVVLLCFFLSGASGLVLEEVWTRELTLVFGSTTLAVATVLSVFMGGLALGSRLGGRIADRTRDRLQTYALAEAGVGLYALLVPLLLTFFPALNRGLYHLFGDHLIGLSLGRFAGAAILLLVPTTLMGATLPILSRHFVAGDQQTSKIGATVGTLYAINTFGAVVGTFVGGFVLLPEVGVRATNIVAAATNLSLFALVLGAARLAARHQDPLALAPVAAPEPGPPDAFIADERQRAVALYAFAFSGAAAMLYQVLWTRALAIVLGSSIYSFTLILLAFLIGLSSGAALTSRLSARSARPVEWLAGVHLAVALMVGFSYLVMDKLPAGFLALLRGSTLSVNGILFCQFLLAGLAILPATFCMGGVLPLTLRIYASGPERVGREVGDAYSVNTVGAIVGSFAAGFVVLPVLGLQRGLGLGAFISVALASAMLLVTREKAIKRTIALAALLPILALATMRALPRWSLEHFSAGLFRIAIAKDIIATNKWTLPKLEFYKDGIATTVSVERWGKTVALKNNGKVDASNGADMATQIMVGLYPLLFHPTAIDNPPNVAVIGFGSGVTIGAVTQFPIAHADVVELEPSVVEAGTRFFGPYNHHPERDPRVRIVIGDGRNFLTQSDDKYDAIVSEPSNPWITGVSNLFTVDYWRLARRRLADDGVFCQWAQLYEMSTPDIKSILRSFAEVFPYTYAFSAEDLSADVILVAANHPLPLDLEKLRRDFKNPRLKAELGRGEIHSAEDVVGELLLTPEEIPAFTAGAPLNTDDDALIEFAAPRDLLGAARTSDPYLARIYAPEWPYGHFEPYLRLGKGMKRAQDELALAHSLLAHGKRPAAMRMLSAAKLDGAPAGTRMERLLASLAERPASDREVPLANSATAEEDSGLSALDPPLLPSHLDAKQTARIAGDYLVLVKSIHDRAWGHALWALRDWPEGWVDESGSDFSLTVGYLLYKADMPDEATDRLKPLLDLKGYAEKRPALLYYLARAEYGDGIFEAAVRNMERYLTLTSPEKTP